MLIKIDDQNYPIFFRLIQDYEREFSSITGKRPGPDGLFQLDTHLGESIQGYVWDVHGSELGFVLIDLGATTYGVCEFYVIPSARGKGVGAEFFRAILKAHPGFWEVKQIQGADKAKTFWRKAIGDYTNGEFCEDICHDTYWGKVTRQTFQTK